MKVLEIFVILNCGYHLVSKFKVFLKEMFLKILYFHHIILLDGSKGEKQLIQHLLNDLEPQERPVENHSDNITVKLGLTILRIDDLVKNESYCAFFEKKKLVYYVFDQSCNNTG